MVLHTFNRTLLEPPGGPYEEQTIHGMLEFWAAATPAAAAVEFEVSIFFHPWRLSRAFASRAREGRYPRLQGGWHSLQD